MDPETGEKLPPQPEELPTPPAAPDEPKPSKEGIFYTGKKERKRRGSDAFKAGTSGGGWDSVAPGGIWDGPREALKSGRLGGTGPLLHGGSGPMVSDKRRRGSTGRTGKDSSQEAPSAGRGGGTQQILLPLLPYMDV